MEKASVTESLGIGAPGCVAEVLDVGDGTVGAEGGMPGDEGGALKYTSSPFAEVVRHDASSDSADSIDITTTMSFFIFFATILIIKLALSPFPTIARLMY